MPSAIHVDLPQQPYDIAIALGSLDQLVEEDALSAENQSVENSNLSRLKTINIVAFGGGMKYTRCLAEDTSDSHLEACLSISASSSFNG